MDSRFIIANTGKLFITKQIWNFFARLPSIMSITSVKCSWSTFKDSLCPFISAYRISRYINSGSQDNFLNKVHKVKALIFYWPITTDHHCRKHAVHFKIISSEKVWQENRVKVSSYSLLNKSVQIWLARKSTFRTWNIR